jgi:hypothetical protein
VAGVVAAGLLAFLFFFTCFLVVGVELAVGAAAVCAASDNPAVASVRESPSNTAEIFFMVFVRFLCRGGLFLPLQLLTMSVLTRPEQPVKYDSPDINVAGNTLGID